MISWNHRRHFAISLLIMFACVIFSPYIVLAKDIATGSSSNQYSLGAEKFLIRIAADDGDAKKAEKRGEKSFPQTDNVKLASYQVKKIEKGEKKDKQGVKRSYMEVTAKIKGKILFLSIAPIEYSYKAQSRIID
ncbi:hypothetical protein [Thermoactinomyces sp. DSM 45892]|uniref:hypothetical protein n=1 Tax=Thermoactinomyces sp. DSM 45892 TaxID=1882753 RepID=UPI00089D04FE|nr:hypothetical protein [Thermoactinomyces sp. DSM 45892]SDY12483.1 hypothetical protein SAMN05444416_10271 [Thermoactinomyces sp. DSM 45892]